jgi:glycosyltransferase involved in cell wall biosynthesis
MTARALRICRVTRSLPYDEDPAAGLHPYVFTQRMPVPTLVITKQLPAEKHRMPMPDHASVVAIPYQDVGFSSRLESELFREGPPTLAERFRIGRQLLRKSQELRFVLKAIPPVVRFRPDIVHLHGVLTLALGVFARLVLGARVVITLHNVTEAIMIRRLPFLRWMLRAPERILCVSPAIMEELRPLFPAGKLAFTPAGVDLRSFEDEGRPRKKQILAVGHFKWQKGYPHMLEAMTRVAREFPDHRLVIVGDGIERPGIERQIQALGLGDRVTLLGIVSRLEVARLLNESELFVMSSLVEGLPKALLEALACGTPAVVTTACNAEGIIERTGLVVPPRDSAALAAAIGRMLGDEALRARCAAACRAVVQDYSWETIAQRVWEIYTEGVPARRVEQPVLVR